MAVMPEVKVGRIVQGSPATVWLRVPADVYETLCRDRAAHHERELDRAIARLVRRGLPRGDWGDGPEDEEVAR